jgi:hypothetical protein
LQSSSLGSLRFVHRLYLGFRRTSDLRVSAARRWWLRPLLGSAILFHRNRVLINGRGVEECHSSRRLSRFD